MFWNKVVGWKCFTDCLNSIIKKTGLEHVRFLQQCLCSPVTPVMWHCVMQSSGPRGTASWAAGHPNMKTLWGTIHLNKQSHIPDDLSPQIPFLSLLPHLFLQRVSNHNWIQGWPKSFAWHCNTEHPNRRCQHFKFLVCLSVIMALWLAGWLASWLAMDRGHLWETDNSSNSQEIPHISWNLQVHYYIHNSPSPVPVLSHTNWAHIFWSCSLTHTLILTSHPCTVFHVVIFLQVSSPKPHNYFCSTYMLHVLPI